MAPPPPPALPTIQALLVDLSIYSLARVVLLKAGVQGSHAGPFSPGFVWSRHRLLPKSHILTHNLRPDLGPSWLDRNFCNLGRRHHRRNHLLVLKIGPPSQGGALKEPSTSASCIGSYARVLSVCTSFFTFRPEACTHLEGGRRVGCIHYLLAGIKHKRNISTMSSRLSPLPRSRSRTSLAPSETTYHSFHDTEDKDAVGSVPRMEEEPGKVSTTAFTRTEWCRSACSARDASP